MALSPEVQVNTLDKINEPKLLADGWLREWSDWDNKKKSKGLIDNGAAICHQPEDQRIMINATTPLGHGNLIYMMMTYTMPKMHYNMSKVDENISVSPAYPEMYGRIIAKKKELEGHIKAGLASAAQAVADYELLKHDERKYREILDYFEEGKKDEHVLRALFIDRVDAHTGEGYSMISMTKRWPTIITDFIRVSTVDKAERSDVKKIRAKLAITEAEATVLKTKNNVFEEWKKTFFPDIKDRYARVKTLVDSRRKSIDEYREWLKPHVASMKMMKDSMEANPSTVFMNAQEPWHKPDALYEVRLFMWKAFSPEEVGKPGFIEGEISPYDAFVEKYIPEIEKNYGVKIFKTKKEFEDYKKKMVTDPSVQYVTEDDVIIVDERIEKWGVQGPQQIYERNPKLEKHKYFYCFYDMDIGSPIFKMEGSKEEIDDWNLLLFPYLITQNVLLLILLEIEAKEHWLNKYVKELIGVREVEDKVRAEVMKKYPELDPSKDKKKEKGFKGFVTSVKSPYVRVASFEKKVNNRAYGWYKKQRPLLRGFAKYFMRLGPYETVNAERLSKMYGRYMGTGMTDPIISFVKSRFGKLSGLEPP
jgi:hypothetical protein